MNEYEIQRIFQEPDGRIVVAITDSPHAVALQPPALSYRGAEYGLTDPAQILELIIRECMLGRVMEDPRDDPALAAGWVTAKTPDAQMVWLYTAKSTAEAWAAHQVRTADGGLFSLADPERTIPAAAAGLELDSVLVAKHREDSDTLRWVNVYGALPVEPPLPRGVAHA